jgi:predicted  nucleic acid-binding Zn-ribbon protein
MPTPVLESLLILQDRDAKRLGIEAQLKSIPVQIASVEASISQEKAAIEAARAERQSLEAKKKVLETEIGSAEQKLATYKTQQLSVRKNDEYQALGNQIQTTQGQIGELESQELELMYAIDEAKKRFAAAEAVLKENIAGYEGRIRDLQAREKSLTEEMKGALTEVEKARTGVDPRAIQIYDRRARRGLPVVVPVRQGKCGGCHLKISSEAESLSRGKGPEGELATCDQCGRIIYFES